MNNERITTLMNYLDIAYDIVDNVVRIGQYKQSPIQYFNSITDKTVLLKDGRLYAVVLVAEEMQIKADWASLKYLDKLGDFLIFELTPKVKKTSFEKLVQQNKKGFEKALKLITRLGKKFLLPPTDYTYQFGKLDTIGDKFTYIVKQLNLPNLDIGNFAEAVFNIHFKDSIICTHNTHVYFTEKTESLFGGNPVSLPWRVATLLCNLDKDTEIEITLEQNFTSVYIPSIDVSFKEKTDENDLKKFEYYRNVMFDKYIGQLENSAFTTTFELKTYGESKDAKLIFEPNANDNNIIDVKNKLYLVSEHVCQLLCNNAHYLTEPLGLDNNKIQHMIKYLELDKNNCTVEFSYYPSLSVFRAVRGNKAAHAMRSSVN
jgi:hypothetical protein